MKQRFGPTKIASIIKDVVAPIYKEKGEILARLLADWPEIVGHEIADAAVPTRLVFAKDQQAEGVLYLKVYGSYATEISHQTPQIIERIATFMGYKAVGQIRLSQ